MTLYSEKKCKWTLRAGNRLYLDMTWHQTQPLLVISVFDDMEGCLLPIYDHLKWEVNGVDIRPRLYPDNQNIRIKHGNLIQTIAIAIGYKTGEVIVWNHGEYVSFEGRRNHEGPVSIYPNGAIDKGKLSGGGQIRISWIKPGTMGGLMAENHLNFEIKSCFTATSTHFCRWSGSEVKVYIFEPNFPSNQSKTGFSTNTSYTATACMFDQYFFILKTEQILFKSDQTSKFLSGEGQPITISLVEGYPHLNDIRAVSDYSEIVKRQQKLDARITMLAIQLNMMKENKSRYDEAIDMFTKSEPFGYDIPKMLVDKPDKLEKYIMDKEYKELYQWGCQYLETGGNVIVAEDAATIRIANHTHQMNQGLFQKCVAFSTEQLNRALD